MFMKKFLSLLFPVFLLLIASGCFDYTDDLPDEDLINYEWEGIKVDSQSISGVLESPVVVSGEATGTWFFEANFSATLQDTQGNNLATVILTAQDDWMTEDFVPFKGEIPYFLPSSSESGVLIFEAANPSGLEEHARTFVVPVTLPTATSTVKVFWGSTEAVNELNDCSIVKPAEREIAKTRRIAYAAMHKLLEGPTDKEIQNDNFSSIPEGVRVESINIKDGTAKIAFNDAFFNIGGSCSVIMAGSQIDSTLKQFPGVTKVEISVAGSNEPVLQP